MVVAIFYIEGVKDGLVLTAGRLMLVARQPLVARIAAPELEHCCTWSPGVDIGTIRAIYGGVPSSRRVGARAVTRSGEALLGCAPRKGLLDLAIFASRSLVLPNCYCKTLQTVKLFWTSGLLDMVLTWPRIEIAGFFRRPPGGACTRPAGLLRGM